MQKWNINLGLEIGCVKPWGTTAKEAFAKQRNMWERFESLGGKIGISARVRQNYPDVHLGETEAYPFTSLPDLIDLEVSQGMGCYSLIWAEGTKASTQNQRERTEELMR